MPTPEPRSPPSASEVILVVDDIAINRQVLGLVLRKVGYQILFAGSAAEAMQQVNLQVPDLIMLDIMMPGIDGYSLCRRLRSEARTEKVPIIFISALNETEDKVKAFEAGGADYVTKPFQAAEVLARVAHQLKITRLQRDLEREKSELLHANEKLREALLQTAAVFNSLTEILPGLVLDGKYRIEEKIGCGGWGVVYRATHLSLERPVAIKVFRPPTQTGSADALSRFQAEGISTCRVNHPNAISVLDSGISSQGIAYLVMELLDGPTLYDELLQQSRLSIKRCMQIIIPLCEVLVAAHAAGIVHRDIKPENIMLHQTPSGEVVKVLDFGIAKLLGSESHNVSRRTADNQIVGTPNYMAPERLTDSEYDGRSDVYSVGVLFYEMLTGRGPFPGNSRSYAKVAFNHLNISPAPLRTYRPNVSEELAALVLGALTKDPELRPTAQQLRDELISLMQEGALGEEVAEPDEDTQATSLDGSPSPGSIGLLSRKEAAELRQQWNAGESNPSIEYVVKLDANDEQLQ